MKRRPKVHLMKEHDRTRARCGAAVDSTRLTDVWQQITCKDCLPEGQRERVEAYFAKGN